MKAVALERVSQSARLVFLVFTAFNFYSFAQTPTALASAQTRTKNSQANSSYKLQYKNAASFVDAPRIMFVLAGTRVDFKITKAASAKSGDTSWYWSTPSHLAQRGSSVAVAFNKISKNARDFQIVSARRTNSPRGETLKTQVLVYDLSAVLTPEDNFPGRSQTDYGIGEKLHLSFKTSPPVSAYQAGGLAWALDGSGDDVVTNSGLRDGLAIFDVGSGQAPNTLKLKICSGPSRGVAATVEFEAPDAENIAALNPALPPHSIPHSLSTDEELWQDVEGLQSFRSKPNFSELKKAASQLQFKWSQRDDDIHFAQLMIALSGLFHSIEFSENLHGENQFGEDQFGEDQFGEDQYRLAQQFALRGLQKRKTISAELEAALIQNLTHYSPFLDYQKLFTGQMQSAQWSFERSAKAKLWLELGQRIDREIDRNFNIADVRNWPIMNLRPTENLDDPQARAAFEAAVTKNNRKAEKLHEQNSLHDLDAHYFEQMEKYLIAEYSVRPFNTRELTQFLNTYMQDKKRKAQVLSAVQKAQNSNSALKK